MELTKKTICALKLPEGKTDVEFWDEKLRGFGVRVRPGSSTFFYWYRIGGIKRRMTLGPAAVETVDAVRESVGKLIARVKLGEDPALDKETRQQQAGVLVGSQIALFLERQMREWKPATYAEAQRYLTRTAAPLHKLPVTGVTQARVVELLDEIAENSGDVSANRARSALSHFFNWVQKRGIELPNGNPVQHAEKRSEKSRERVLTDDELRAIWNACGDDDYGAIVKLLMLTGQRRDEIARLSYAELVDPPIKSRGVGFQIELPGLRTKNGREHIVPLSDAAKAILDRFPADGREYLFGRDETNGFARSYTRPKERLDARAGFSNWRIHDLRRTCATGMANLGVAPHVVEAVLNHISGSKGGVAGIYNKAQYLPERRAALTLWAAHLTAIVEGRLAKVVSIKQRA
jgi:integrase